VSVFDGQQEQRRFLYDSCHDEAALNSARTAHQEPESQELWKISQGTIEHDNALFITSCLNGICVCALTSFFTPLWVSHDAAAKDASD